MALVTPSPNLVGERLVDVLGIPPEHYKNYKVHFAVFSPPHNHPRPPLDVLKDSRKGWMEWNSNAPDGRGGNQYDRKYILSTAQYDINGNDKHTWLFCCVFQVPAGWRETDVKTRQHYEVETIDLGKGYSGYLLVEAPPRKFNQVVRINLDDELSQQQLSKAKKASRGAHLYDHLIVKEVLGSPHRDWEW